MEGMPEIPDVEAVPAKPLERREAAVVVLVRRRNALGRATTLLPRARIEADMMGWSYINVNRVVRIMEQLFNGADRE